MQPAVGDWVALKYAEGTQSVFLYDVLPRKTKFSRAAAGIEVKEQIVAEMWMLFSSFSH
jgi:ribosome biogenesis GTPase